MWRNKYLKDWSNLVSCHFPNLSLPEVAGLATWSFGMVITNSSSLTRVSELIARINSEKTNTVRQRLKEWYQDSKAKKGKKRRELEVKSCFAPLLKWIISLWNSSAKFLPLAIDVTNIGQNFTVLSLNVLYQGTGIPVAWKIVKGTEKGSWKPYWLELFQLLKDAVPSDWEVIVAADRGLYADWLFDAICEVNWHPFLRINHQGTYQIPGEQEWKSLNSVVTLTGISHSLQVTCFQTNPINCTLLARIDPGYKEPWLVLTDFKPSQADVLWYGFRSWIEGSYRDFKSDGWQWHKTRLQDPKRAERLWLAMSVATIWTLTNGTNQEQYSSQSEPTLCSTHDQKPKTSALDRASRNISVFLQGLIAIIADLLMGKGIQLNPLSPYPSFSVNTS
jgi:hypothetical protein